MNFGFVAIAMILSAQITLAHSNSPISMVKAWQRCAELLNEGQSEFSAFRVRRDRTDHPFLRDLDSFVLFEEQPAAENYRILIRAITRKNLNRANETPVEISEKSLKFLSVTPLDIKLLRDYKLLGTVRLIENEGRLILNGFSPAN